MVSGRLREMMALATAEQDKKTRNQGMPASQKVGDLDALLCEPFEMPEGEVWLHPISLIEETWAGVKAQQDARKVGVSDNIEAGEEVNTRRVVYVVIAAARRTNDPNSDRVYTVEDAAKLLTSPRYRKKVPQAALIVDRLGGDDYTRESFESFFEQILGRLNGLCSQSNGEVVTICRRDLEAFVSWLSCIRQRRTLSVDEDAPELNAAESPIDAQDEGVAVEALNGGPEGANGAEAESFNPSERYAPSEYDLPPLK